MAMLVVPPLLMMYPQTTVVPTLVLASLVNTTSIAWALRREIQPGLVGPLVAGAVLGIPVGVYFLKSIPGEPFKAGVGVFMMVLAALLLSGWTRPIRNPHAALYPVGFASGILNGSISISGPPIVLFLANQQTPRDAFRANIVTFFSASGLFAVAAFAASGVLTGEKAVFAAGFWPAILVGSWLGMRLAGRINQRLFQRLTLITAGAMGLVLFVQNAWV